MITRRLVQEHIAQLWGKSWWLPLLPVLYVLGMSAFGFFRWEYVVVGVVCPVLAYASRRTKNFFADISPYVAFGIGYDAVKYLIQATITKERVLACGLRDLELALFSVRPGVTPQDYLTAHATVGLDLLFAIPYAVFFSVAFIYAAFLFRVDRPRMRYFLWSFAIANFIAFACWVLVPAAPPWYIRNHGCEVDLSTPAYAAGLLRVDAILGIQYFESFYSRASQVFGALPSMHCAFPALGLLTAWRFTSWRTRPIHIGYTLLMFGASVYLDHHWIIDGIAGWGVALLAVWLTQRVFAALGWKLSDAELDRAAEKESGLAAA
jgi:membrane-associated phospholipid phosphatase